MKNRLLETSAGRSFDRLPAFGALDRTITPKRPWKKQLHPEFFDNETQRLRPEMQQTMVKMVQGFLRFMGIPKQYVKDIHFKGSVAGYNYTSTSDIDLQVILKYNYAKNPARRKDDPNGRELQRNYNHWRAEYNKMHKLTLGKEKFPVEFFIHTPDSATPTGSSVRWSVKNNDWVPGYKPTQDIKTPKKTEIQGQMKPWYNKIKNAYTTGIKHGLPQVEAAKEALRVLQGLARVDRNLALHGPGAGLRADVESPQNLAFKAMKRTNLVAYLEKIASKGSLNESVENEIQFIEMIAESDGF